MTTTAPATTDEFTFSADNVKPGDIYHLKHSEGEVAIIVTAVIGPQYIQGMGASHNNTWSGYLGRIIFRNPIRVGEVTDATFNQSGITSRLEVRVMSLTRERHGKRQVLMCRTTPGPGI